MSHNPYKEYAQLLITSLLTTLLGIKVGEILLLSGFSFLMNPIILFILSIVLILITGTMKEPFKRIVFHIFALIEGLTLTPVMLYYLKVMPTTLMQAVMISIGLIGIFLMVGYRAKNLTPWGSCLFISLLGLLVFSLVDLFLIPIPFLTYLGLVLFCAYIAYDINRFKQRLLMTGGQMMKEEVTTHVVNQYLNIINLFLHVLESLNRD